MRRTLTSISVLVVALGLLTYAPAVLQARVTTKALACNAQCPQGSCSSSGLFCSCHCDANGNPSCGCLF